MRFYAILHPRHSSSCHPWWWLHSPWSWREDVSLGGSHLCEGQFYLQPKNHPFLHETLFLERNPSTEIASIQTKVRTTILCTTQFKAKKKKRMLISCELCDKKSKRFSHCFPYWIKVIYLCLFQFYSEFGRLHSKMSPTTTCVAFCKLYALYRSQFPHLETLSSLLEDGCRD